MKEDISHRLRKFVQTTSAIFRKLLIIHFGFSQKEKFINFEMRNVLLFLYDFHKILLSEANSCLEPVPIFYL